MAPQIQAQPTPTIYNASASSGPTTLIDESGVAIIDESGQQLKAD